MRTLRALAATFSLTMVLTLSGCEQGEPPVASEQVADRGLFSAALSHDGNYALIGSLQHGGSLWKTDSFERIFNWNHEAGAFTPITVSAMTGHGRFALTVESDRMVLWNAVDGRALTFFSAPANVLDAALGPDGRYALLGLSDTNAVLFDAKKGGIKRTFHTDGRVWSVALDASGSLALTGGEDEIARLWDVESGTEKQRWEHNNEIRGVALSEDGSLALTIAKYDRAAVWDTQSGLLVGRLPQSRWRLVRGEVFTTAAISSDNKYILTGTTARDVHLFEMPGPRLVKTWSLSKTENWKRSAASVIAVGFTETDGNFIAISADGYLHRLKQ